MRKLIILALFLLPFSAFAAIARDQSTTGNAASGNLSFNTNPSAGANILVVAVDHGTLADCSSDTVTYNSVSMKKIDEIIVGSVLKASVFALLNPTSGSHSVAITNGCGAGDINGYAASYTGGSNTTIPTVSAHNSTSSGTSLSVGPITPLSTNDWIAGIFRNDVTNSPTFTNVSLVIGGINGNASSFDDSNGTITSPITASTNISSNGNITGIFIDLPAASSTPTTSTSIIGLVRAFW